MAKYTEEELSRILTAHAARKLIRHGHWHSEYCDPDCSVVGCVNQAAYIENNGLKAAAMNPLKVEWFDDHYSPKMAPEKLLRHLEE